MIPIYTNHLNLGFNKGTLLPDPHNLLKGTGKLMQHIPITSVKDFDNEPVTNLINAAIALSQNEMKSLKETSFKIISKIKR